MTNFKCFRSKQIHFNKDVTTISGRNGAGKTTIADAILWCLFGKNLQGQSDFDLKTHDETGKPIPNLDHSVELQLATVSDGSPSENIVTLKRTLKESWIKKRGSEELVFKNNTTEYMINGESLTATDYKKYISGIISEDIFRAITNPSFFPSLKWQQQRDFLTSMAGDITPETDSVEFVALLKQLTDSKEDIIAYRKHLSYQIKQIKDKLDRIPVRLEEQNKALPEKQDWSTLEASVKELSEKLRQVEEQLFNARKGNTADIRREEIRRQIADITAKKEAAESLARKEYNVKAEEQQRIVSSLSMKFNETVNNQRLLEQTIEADKRLMETCSQSIQDADVTIERLRNEWPSRKFTVDPDTQFCPTCGQLLPQEQYKETVNRMRENFNRALEEEKQELRAKAAKVKKEKEDAQVELKRYQDKLNEDTLRLDEIKAQINDIFTHKAEAAKTTIPSVSDILAADHEYTDLMKRMEDLNTSLASVTDTDDDKELLTSLDFQKEVLTDELSQTQALLASRSQYDRIQSLIEGINNEKRELIEQLSELERKEDTARNYQNRQNEILETRINEHFSLVKWRMFRTVNNGGDPFQEPYCECYVNGVAYHDGLNQAARLNAGLDICDTLSKFYGVSAPIVIDNAEAVNNILPTTGQQIQMYVSTDEHLIIE
jgi:DNA repair exonuclease SbcCD ATPase subunit